MCLGIPGRVVEIVPGFAGQLALVDVQGAQRRINIGMLDTPPPPGSWVLIHMGFAVELIDEAAAEKALSGLELMGRPREPGPHQGAEPAEHAPTWARDLGWESDSEPAEPGPAADSVAAAGLESVTGVAAGVGRVTEPHPGTGWDPVEQPRTTISGARPPAGQPAGGRIRCRYTVSGLVQGVGFRPFAYSLASRLALAGEVANTGAGVVVEVEGEPAAVREYGRRLRADAPPLAMVTAVDAEGVPAVGGTGFTIGPSDGDGPARTLASPDVAICDDCRRELTDPADRRCRHPFITCTNCGPRFTIIESLPYDRAATTMAGFPMCPACRAEYADPADRRFHAQPIACPDCGPRLELFTPDGDAPSAAPGGSPGTDYGDEPVARARRLLAAGRIVAVKGLGGYHLACDARNAEAVAELRRRKRRGGQPFAVMVRDLAAARELVTLTPGEVELLTGVRKPIVLAARRPGADVAAGVAPGQPDLGVLLPYTPLHVLLFGVAGDPPGPDALVMTSGNLSGEPIVTGDGEALTRLAPLADAWLRHDRPIRVPCDDSVSRYAGGAELPIRRSRGYAPLPIALPFDVPPILAAGADLKSTCAVAAGRYAWVSQHIGDLDDVATIDALTRTAAHLTELTGVRPEIVVADRHPDYRSADWARRQTGRHRRVQHHHAHVASVLAEHGIGPDEQVIGVAFDGTGYGTDGAVWGGEVLIAGYKSFHRAFHLAYVPLAGGDASVRRPYRMALSHLRAAGVAWDPGLPPVAACPPAERGLLDRQFASGAGCVPTSSMGRLFDAVAALAGVRQIAGYEAEAAMLLEGAARHGTGDAYGFGLRDGIADPAPVIRAVARDVLAGVPAADVAARFHAAVTTLIVDLAVAAEEQTGLRVVALGGGVFQNALLIEAAGRALAERGFTVLRPRRLPPNDGGIALGQIVAGAF
jgi:hydrogenase maturation protein HypF